MSEHRGNNAIWPPARVAKLKKLWAEGKSGSEIAEILGGGLSRAAVIGKANRLGCAARGAPANFSTYMPTVRRDRAPVVRSTKQAGAFNARQGRPPKPGPQNRPGAVFGAVSVNNPEETERKRQACQAEGERVRLGMAEPANDTALPLIDRTRFQCSWPVGEPERPAEQMCCGMPVPEGANSSVETYCAKHARKAVSRTLVGGKPDAKVYERSLRRFA
jgi:GcrA cell cycle regulator